MSKYINSLMQISAASVAMMSAVVADQANMNNSSAQMCQMNNPCTIYPALNNGYGVHLDVGYLLEQFVLTGTDFAFTQSGSSFNTLPQSAKVLRPTFNVASGVTAELGYYFEHDCWFWNTKFDYVSRKGHGNWSSDGSSEFVVPNTIWTPGMIDGEPATYFAAVDSDLKVSYYNLQTDLNRGFYTTGNLAFEPHMGLKAAFIYYTGHTEFTGGSAEGEVLEHEQTTKFWGLGPDFGLNSQWNFTKHFSMFCDTTVALLCGGANVKDEAEYGESDQYRTYAKENPIVMSPAARIMLGFQYNSAMYNDSQNVRIRLGLDSSYYWNQFQHMAVSNQYNGSTFNLVDGGGFGMIGMLVELGWDF
ncbi:MAG: hypothetical protein FJZ59_04515 [Chlamydiae bacterium]|nr:hypothetical protein [Chlamydiota bacterium]